MIKSRRHGRECALQMLYQVDLAGGDVDAVAPHFWSTHSAEAAVREFAQTLARRARERLEEIDGLLAEAAEHWRLDRMAAVDRNILRMAVCELLCDRQTPSAVVIDEAIEIAKKFGGEDSGQFVNGVLDSVRKRLGIDVEESAESVGATPAPSTASEQD